MVFPKTAWWTNNRCTNKRNKFIPSCASITTNKLRLHCFAPDILLAGIENVGIYLFQFYHLIGSHCLGGPGFSNCTESLQPYKRKGLNWPFDIFLGVISDCNAAFLQ